MLVNDVLNSNGHSNLLYFLDSIENGIEEVHALLIPRIELVQGVLVVAIFT